MRATGDTELVAAEGPSTLIALGALRLGDRQFIPCLLAFACVLWGTLARGAFYRTDLLVFTVLAAAGGAAALLLHKRPQETQWWVVTALAPFVAAMMSALMRGMVGDVSYALAPILAALSLGVVGATTERMSDQLLMLRIVVDVASLAALLCWLGVALHLPLFAQLQNQGWRATATIGYANVTGLVLLIGLLCACGLAAISRSTGDSIRCWLLTVGLLATQSRSVILAMVVCGLLLHFFCRSMATVLTRSVGFALVAFAGLLPSIRGDDPNPAPAIGASVLALVVLFWTRRLTMSSERRILFLVLSLGALVLGVVILRARIFDNRSNSGRIRLWDDALAQLHLMGFAGTGPHELADLSRGQEVTLLVHSDPLQYLKYYGPLGLLALTVIVLRLVHVFVKSHPAATNHRELWAVAVTVCLAGSFVAMVDFPMQVPLVPAVISLVLGAALRPGAMTQKSVGKIQHGPLTLTMPFP